MKTESRIEEWVEAHKFETMALVAVVLFLSRLGHQAYAYYVTLGH